VARSTASATSIGSILGGGFGGSTFGAGAGPGFVTL